MNEAYAPWVKKLLIEGLYGTGNETPWMDHNLLIHKERRGQLLGGLEREIILEMRDKWIPMAAPYLENPAVSDGDRKKLEKDMHAVKWAGICADRYADHVAQEEWRAKQPVSSTIATPEKVAMDTQANPFVPDAPLEGSPASGENDEARRGETLEPNEKDLGLQFAKLKEAINQGELSISEGQSQPAPAPPPVAPLATRAQGTSEAEEPSTTELVDPAFIHTQEQFLEACQIAAQHLIEAQNVWQAKRVVEMGEMLEALARTKALGKEFELFGKEIRFRAYFKVAQFRIPNAKNGQKLIDPTDKRLVHDLEKLTEEGFEHILHEGLEKGNLAERLFRVSASKSTKGTPKTRIQELDPGRFFLSFIVDMRTNPSFYSQVNAGKLLEDPRILENLDPIEEHYVAFSIAIIGALRAKRALQNVPHGTT